jgi:hypothetical protein
MGIMSTKINADNGVVSGSGGLKETSDASGVLELQTNGITGIIIDGSQNVTIAGTLTATGGVVGVGGGGDYIARVYTAPATWTKPTNLKAVKVTVLGGGGNGGSAVAPSVGSSNAGGGGGGGQSMDYIPAPSITADQSITAGISTTSSFGSFVSATSGGNGTNATATSQTTAAGVGGTGVGGMLIWKGNNGSTGSAATGGTGGISAQYQGIGGTGVSNATGTAASGYGAGGGGAGRTGANATVNPGGSGSTGYVIVEEYY